MYNTFLILKTYNKVFKLDYSNIKSHITKNNFTLISFIDYEYPIIILEKDLDDQNIYFKKNIQ